MRHHHRMAASGTPSTSGRSASGPSASRPVSPGLLPTARTDTSASTAGAASPRPRRLRGPSWLDLRLIGGVALVLISVLVGARVISAADQSVSVWAAATDLSAGTTLRAEDVQSMPVRLFDSSTAYLQSSADLTGQVLDRPVHAGELLPASALRQQVDRVSVALPVPSSAVPLDLHRGQLVDVYATGDGRDGSPAQTTLVLAGAPVQAVDGGSRGALSASSGMRQVVVSVPSEQAGALFAAIAGQDLAVAILEDLTGPAGRDGTAPPLGPSAPTTAAPPAASTTPSAVPTTVAPTT